MTEQRGSTLRRQINGIGMHGGEAQESKIWAQIGKGLCVWLIWKLADVLVLHWETLFTLLLFIIAPELIKKFITMRFGGGSFSRGGYTERTERVTHDSAVTTTTPSKVDNPDANK